jgi:regulator of sigma E protease
LTPEERARSFQAKPLAVRAAVVAAGPIANFILAILIFTAIFAVFGERITAAKVDIVNPGSAAERAGFLPGDQVVSIDGKTIESFGEMQRIVGTSPDQPLHFVVDRNGQAVDITATPERKEITDHFGNTIRLGLLGIQRSASPDDWTLKRHDPLTAFGMAIKESYFVISRSLGYLYDVVTGREAADQLGGPIRIAQVSGQVASAGFIALLNLAAIISVSIGLLNLFPIPMLDGGHLLFYGIEAIRGRPLSESTQEIGFRIGLAFVLMLMIFATWNDLIHLKFL